MAESLQVYKCELCGNIVEVLHGGEGELVCCGQPMVFLKENTVDAAKEKHVPVIEKIDGGVQGQGRQCGASHGGEAFHRMGRNRSPTARPTESSLRPGQAPEATFEMNATTVTAREYCNLHGLWKCNQEFGGR